MPLIRENFFNQIKQSRHLTDIILISQNFKATGEPSNLQNSRSMRFLRKYFFNAFPRALCFAWKKAAVTHVESIQNSFWWIGKDCFTLLWKQKTPIWAFGKEQEKHLNLITVHFKTRNFKSRGSPVTKKDTTFESDKKGSLLSEIYGEILLKYNI